jgi:hypothetical protein
MNIAKIDCNVAHVAMVVFQMFQLPFQMYVASRGGTRGRLAGAVATPLSTVDSFNTYINICIYSTKNINFIENLLKHIIMYILSH